MADEIKKVKIKDLPQTTSIGDDDIFVESDSLETYKVVADDIAKYVSTNKHLTNKYIPLDSKGVANGVAPLNSNKKINGTYITYGKASNTAYEGINGKTLETNLDNHLTDADAHGYETKINNETTRAKAAESTLTTKINKKLETSLKGVANGLAELDENGKVPSSQLPSYVDDVLEYSAKSSFPTTGETGKIYVDTSTNLTYRWSGSAYVEISPSLALGETSSTAYRGDRGKIAYDHSQSTHARTDATKVEKSSTNGNIKINGTETTVYTHPSGTNPHGTTKSDVGLGNVGNFKAVSTVANQGLTDTEKSNARTNIGAGTSSFSGSYNDLTNKPSIPSGAAASKGVDTSISAASTSTNLPTSKAVASFVEGKGYKTTDNNTTYSLSKSGSTITLTGSDGSKTSVTDSSGSSGSSVSFTRNLTSGTKVGTITIDGTSTDLYAPTDTNTTYSAGTGLSLSGTTFNHKNSVTSGTAQGDASKTLSFGGTFTVPTVTYDAQGHITGKGTTTMTMPTNPNTDTKNTAGSTNTSSKLFLIGATSQAVNPQTYSHDTAYVGTDGCLYSNSTRVVSEVVSSTEPTGQKVGDYWCQDY